ncbi:DUF2799 domain-containing protein [Caulobacter sp. 17J65-9]|uniref:DUF2799 domain-containing protein n=1 Tax=Caulobacter sp. 17J65-9 TaxID=2709382 RepID=UPI0013CC206B|nr:DUF2799 domain-containing protein [Caulobacter sp. 17J65-9]NEX91621.1 DUF2799 domain-containing protein [Caulobacter sp. 17J65-9]
MRRLLIVPALLLLGSCATLDKNECLAGDWQGIGLRDGAAGAPMSRVDDHAKACAPHGVTPDVTAWKRGREQGLLDYCQPQRGFRVGAAGSSYAGVCPADLEPDFLAGYSDGKLIYSAKQDVDRASSDASNAYYEAERLEKEMRQQEARLADPKLTAQERESIRAGLKRLRNDRERALDAMERAKRDESRAQRDLDDLQARFTAIYGDV